MKRPGKRGWFLIAALTIPLALFLARIAILRQIERFLVLDDPVEKADFVFLLNGDVTARPPRAAALVKQGWAPKVVLCRAEDGRLVKSGLARNVTDLSIAILEEEGVRRDQIVQLPVEGGVTSTFDEAFRLRRYVDATGARRVLVVTSAIHTRRSRWAIEHEMRGRPLDIRMVPVADPRFNENNWWRKEEGFLGTQNEYLKLVFYCIRYR